MSFFPIDISLKNKKCIIIGGGRIAERKASSLLSCGAKVKLVSPKLTSYLHQLFLEGKIEWSRKEFEEEDIVDCFLVIGATDNFEVNQRVSKVALKKNLLTNIVNAPKLGNFIFPSIIKQGDLIISISTSGKYPLLSKKIKEDLKEKLVSDYSKFLKLLKEVELKIKERSFSPSERRKILRKIIESDAFTYLKEGKENQARKRVEECIS